MTNPFRFKRQFVAPVFAWTCSLLAVGCGGSFSGPGSGASGGAGVSQGGSAQGGSAQGGSAQGGSAQGGTAQGGHAQGGTAQGGSAQGGNAQGGTAQGGHGATGGSSQLCGGLLGAGCAKGEYCEFAVNAACGAADQTGSCSAIPNVCDTVYSPVCGCDHRTYPNACSAAMSSVSVSHLAPCEASTGSCVLDGVTYPDGTGGIPATDGCNLCSCSGGMLRCTLLACAVPKPCGARAGDTCAETEYCAYTPGALCGAADAEAVCKRLPTSCVATSNTPSVCGCDHKTYLNACVAAQSRTGVLELGSCAGPPN